MTHARPTRTLALALALGGGACEGATDPRGPGLEASSTGDPAASSGGSDPASASTSAPSASDDDPERDDAAPPEPPAELGPRLPPLPPGPGFTLVTEEAGLALDPGKYSIPPWCLLDDLRFPDQTGDYCVPERFLGAAAAADYDGDGDPDLFLTRIDGPGRLMRNRGDGTFEDVAAAAGLIQSHATGAAAWLDVEGDGDLDLMLTSVGTSRNLLYVNDGAGGFDEQGGARGVAVQTGRVHVGMGIGVGDYDRDGWLDLFVADWHPDDALGGGVDHNRLLHNRGALQPGSFDDTTIAMGIDLPALAPLVDAKAGSYGFAPAFVDLDDDGWPELTLTADFGTSRLWWNEGGNALIDQTFASGLGTERNGMGSTFGDYDGDGDLDWFVAAIYSSDYPWLGNRMYRNEGLRQFVDVTDDLGVRNGGWGWGTALFDADLDGDLDLALAAGWPSSEFRDDALSLWLNDGAGPWTERAAELGVVVADQGRGVLPFDYDRDGDLDLLVLTNTEIPRLYRNDLGDGHWLVVQTVGADANTQALGAVVRVQATPEGPTQVRQIGVGSHLFGRGEAVAHVGLGDVDGPVFRVEVTWPTTGQTTELLDVARDQWLVVYE